MRAFYLFLIALLFNASILIGIPAIADFPKVSHVPVSSWVSYVGWTPEHSDNKSTDIAILLRDYQYNHPLEERFVHFVYEIVGKKGIENSSRIKIRFCDEYEEIFLHYCNVHRNGKVLDKLHDASMTIHNGAISQSLIFGDTQDLHIILSDIQKGDIIDYAYTVKGRHSAWGRNVDLHHSIKSSKEIQKSFFRVVVTDDIPLHIKRHSLDGEPVRNLIDNGMVEWIWEFTNLGAVKKDKYLPSWFDPYGWIQVSSYQSWNEVARFVEEIFRVPEDFSNEILHQIEVWQTEFPALEDQVVAAIQFVQSKIRYLSFYKKEQQFSPHHPDSVFRKKYGDCKDQALLLASFLQLLGIHSSIAVVDTDDKQQILEYLPSKFGNHVIVYFEYEGSTYFVDPVSLYQPKRLSQCFLPYRVALVGNSDAEGLTEIPFQVDQGKAKYTNALSVNLSEKSAKLDFEKTSTGYEADLYRYFHGEKQPTEIEDDWLHYFQNYFTEVKCDQPLVCKESPDGNVVMVNCSLLVNDLEDIPNISLGSWKKFPLDIEDRKSPLGIPFPLNYENESHVIFDQNPIESYPSLEYFQDEVIEFESEYIKYKVEKRKLSSQEFIIKVLFQTFVDAVLPEDFDEYKCHMQAFKDALDFSIEFQEIANTDQLLED